jgi:hypothetical protein
MKVPSPKVVNRTAGLSFGVSLSPFVASLSPFVVSLSPFVVSLSNHEFRAMLGSCMAS